MSVVMDVGYANAKLKYTIECSISLVRDFKSLLKKDARGRYRSLRIGKVVILDRVAIKIFMNTCREEGSDTWVNRVPFGRHSVPTEAMKKAIRSYMKIKKIKKFTKEVIMD